MWMVPEIALACAILLMCTSTCKTAVSYSNSYVAQNLIKYLSRLLNFKLHYYQLIKWGVQVNYHNAICKELVRRCA